MSSGDRLIDYYVFKLKKYLITYSKGYINIPFVLNSPRTLVDSARKVPFFKSTQNTVHSNSFVANGFFHHYELETGFWCVISSTYHKKNVTYNLLFDPSSPANYYILSASLVNSNPQGEGKYNINGTVPERNSWLLVKPGSSIQNSYPKGNTNIIITFYLREDWLRKNILNSELETKLEIVQFLKTDQPFIVLDEMDSELNLKCFEITKSVIGNNGTIPDLLNFKIEVLGIIKRVIQRTNSDSEANQIIKEGFILPNEEPLRILNVLHSCLYQTFPGLDYIAEECGISTRSLVMKFKKEHNLSVFQYFRKKQLELAKKKLETENIMVKSVAHAFGYSNVSKFIQAFKNEFGFTPAEIQKKAIK